MSYPRKHRWFHRLALGLALASVMFAGRASVVSATIDPGTAVGDDPYLTDVYVRPGESLGGPDGGPAAPRPALKSKDTSAKADTQADIERMRRIWTDRDAAAPRPALKSKDTSAKADTQADIERMRRIWTDRDAAAPRPALKSKDTSAKADTQADIERMRRIWTDRD